LEEQLITLVRAEAGDWTGLYQDGKLLYEGHSVDDSRLLELLGIEHTVKEDPRVDAWGGCPDVLDNFPADLEVENVD
jgi:hypothetical protein